MKKSKKKHMMPGMPMMEGEMPMMGKPAKAKKPKKKARGK